MNVGLFVFAVDVWSWSSLNVGQPCIYYFQNIVLRRRDGFYCDKAAVQIKFS